MENKEFLEKTLAAWQPYSKEKLTLKDAKTIINNVTNFFDLLQEWDRSLSEKSIEELKI